MLYVMGKKLLPDKSELLYHKEFSEDTLKKDWEIASGEWWVDNGWLNGRIHEDAGGLIYSREKYSGDIMLDFYGRTVPPCRNDLNFTWYSEGWDAGKNDAGVGYIASLNGWWTGKTGIERYPECSLQAATALSDFEAGRSYHIQAGIVQGLNFIFIDGRLGIEMRDPDPIDSKKFGKVGFGVYCSFVQVKNLKIYRLASEDAAMQYTPKLYKQN